MTVTGPTTTSSVSTRLFALSGFLLGMWVVHIPEIRDRTGASTAVLGYLLLLLGGAALVAVKYTKNPEEVAKVIEYLGSAPVVKEFTERTLFLPAHKGIIEAGGLAFQSDDPHVQPALETFVAASQQVAPAAAKLPPWKWANAYYAALVTRTSQVMAGELPLEDAFARMDQDIADQVAAAQQ